MAAVVLPPPSTSPPPGQAVPTGNHRVLPRPTRRC
jgi:hypothetical protein